MKKTMNVFILFGAIILLVCSTINVQAAKKSGFNSFNFGNKQAGACGSYSVLTENGRGYSLVSLTANGDIMFLNKTAKGIEFNGTSQNVNGKKTTTYSLSLAGYNVDSGSKTASYTWNKPVNRTLLQASASFTLGPVPVTVSGSVGGGANIGYTFELSNSGVGLLGNAGGWATGSASAGIGATFLNLSLQSDLQLAKTSLRPSIRVTPTSWSGGADLGYDPVKIDFYLALKTMNKVWYQHNLASYSQPSKNVSLIRL